MKYCSSSFIIIGLTASLTVSGFLRGIYLGEAIRLAAYSGVVGCNLWSKNGYRDCSSIAVPNALAPHYLSTTKLTGTSTLYEFIWSPINQRLVLSGMDTSRDFSSWLGGLGRGERYWSSVAMSLVLDYNSLTETNLAGLLTLYPLRFSLLAWSRRGRSRLAFFHCHGDWLTVWFFEVTRFYSSTTGCSLVLGWRVRGEDSTYFQLIGGDVSRAGLAPPPSNGTWLLLPWLCHSDGALVVPGLWVGFLVFWPALIALAYCRPRRLCKSKKLFCLGRF